jgi:riboflavin kinase/FMN adenylyltransferase
MFADRISDPDHLPPLRLVRDGIAPGHRLRGAVIALGNFDGFHRGHRHLIATAQQLAAGRHPVAIMSVEPHPRQVFGPPGGLARLALPGQKHVMGRILGLDYIYEPLFDRAFAGLTPEAFVGTVLHERLGIAQVVTGADFRFGAGRRGDVAMLAALCAPLGIGVQTVPLRGGWSSTSIRAALAAGDVRTAGRDLGRYWEAATQACGRGLRLAEGLVRLPPGHYALADPGRGTSHEAMLDAEGIFAGLDAPPGRMLVLDRLG